MQTIDNKNRFAAAGFDDSDEEVVQKVSKTQKKKEERKISDKPAIKFNSNKMSEGGFEVVSKEKTTERPQGDRRGGEARGRGRGGRGGEGRGGRGGARPVRLDADGNKIFEERRERKPFTGKPREEAHPMDRKDGTGRGRKPDAKNGHGKANWGDREDVTYKKKGETG